MGLNDKELSKHLSRDLREECIEVLLKRGVTVRDMSLIVLDLQLRYKPELTIEDCDEAVLAVLKKREIQHHLLTGVALDIAAEQGLLIEPIQSIIRSDLGLFGCDETLAIGGTYGYGSIAVTTFGYLDKSKYGIIKKLDEATDHCHTFLDDIVCMICACASGRVAHKSA